MNVTREFEVKLERVRNMLEEKSLFACYIKRQDNFAWLTCGGVNYVAVGDMGNCGILITRQQLFAITNNIESRRMTEEEHLENLGFELLIGTWHDTGFEMETIKKLCGSQSIGFDHGCSEQNISSTIASLRFSLTQEEVARYIAGGRLVSRIVEETAASVCPGDSELSVVAAMMGKARNEGMEILSAFCGSDHRIYQYRHAIATKKRIQERVQMGGNLRYKGLVICCTRYVNFTPVKEELKKQYQDNVWIDCTMINESKVGESYQTPFLAGKKAYEDLGYGDEFHKHHQGGPIGYVPRDYRIDFSHHGTIVPNQAFCWNPSITGTKSEDTVISTINGPVFVTRPYLFPTITLTIGEQTYIRPAILEKY